MRHGSLFSGIGGFDLAAQWVGWTNVFQVEKDEWCRKVLAKNFPNTKRYFDIKDFNARPYHGAVDVISAGFPCQPFSEAGKRLGDKDSRFLWPETIQTVREIRPAWFVGENVTGIISMALDQVLADLAAEGYTTETFIIPAAGINARQMRDRCWIIAYTGCVNGNGGQNLRLSCNEQREMHQNRKEAEHDVCRWLQKAWTANDAGFCGSRNGLPNRVDRLRGLGNAIVPQIAYEIFRVIDLTVRGLQIQIQGDEVQ